MAHRLDIAAKPTGPQRAAGATARASKPVAPKSATMGMTIITTALAGRTRAS